MHLDLQLDLDPTTYRFTGVAIHGNTPFDTTLISHILGNLWMGGCIDKAPLPEDFDNVISLYPWEKYNIASTTMRLEFEMYDDEGGEGSLLNDIVDRAVACLMQGKTLIHCQAGLNRSGLVSAFALMAWKGMSGRDALGLLRQRRSPAVACNPHFEQLILDAPREQAP